MNDIKLYYAGIGSRDCTNQALYTMEWVAILCAGLGITLRSGGADGADSMFEKGCDRLNGNKEIYLPWKGFNNNNSSLHSTPKSHFEIAKTFHPAWDRCSQGAKKLHARNVAQIQGYYSDKSHLTDFVICYTKNGDTKGGTGQAIRMAQTYNIPIFNIGNYLEHTNVNIETEDLKEITKLTRFIVLEFIEKQIIKNSKMSNEINLLIDKIRNEII